MTPIVILLLFLSILCSTSRNLFSKKLSDAPFGSKRFFRFQSALFFAGGILLSAFFLPSGKVPAPLTIAYAICYGILLLSAQWLYTMSMNQGNVGVCSTVYYFGFIIPTLGGVLWWKDSLKVTGIVGIFLVLVSIFLSGLDSGLKKESGSKNSYLIPLIFAMLSSGGLGLMQKIQQISPYPEERTAFVAISFLFAGLVSLTVSFFAAKDQSDSAGNSFLYAILAGVAFSGSNLLNTTLAGMVSLAVFSPILNVGAIIASSIIASVMFREKLSKLDLAVLGLGILAIILIGL